MDRTENTSPNSSSIVASRSCRTDHVENTVSQLVHWCVLGTCCLATGLHATVFLSSTEYETVSTTIRRLMLIHMALNNGLTSTGKINVDVSGRTKKEIVLICFKVQQQCLLGGTEKHSKNPHYSC
jgi:hypothetical protein